MTTADSVSSSQVQGMAPERSLTPLRQSRGFLLFTSAIILDEAIGISVLHEHWQLIPVRATIILLGFLIVLLVRWLSMVREFRTFRDLFVSSPRDKDKETLLIAMLQRIRYMDGALVILVGLTFMCIDSIFKGT